MLNSYYIVEAGSLISLKDERGRDYSIIVNKKSVVISANGFHRSDWKIVIDYDDLKKVDSAITGTWYVDVCKGTIYAKFCKTKNSVREYLSMHRVINDCPTNLVVDHHPNHYGLDNRRENLRNISMEANSGNQFKKVSLHNCYFK